MVDITTQPVTNPSLKEGVQAIEATGDKLNLTAWAKTWQPLQPMTVNI